MNNNIQKGNKPIISSNAKSQLGLINGKVKASSSKTKNQFGLSKILSRGWIPDSGATYHIVSSSSRLTRQNKNDSLPLVLLPSGEKAQISSTGSIPLNSYYILDNVLYIPNFKVDLMSIS